MDLCCLEPVQKLLDDVDAAFACYDTTLQSLVDNTRRYERNTSNTERLHDGLTMNAGQRSEGRENWSGSIDVF